MVKEETNEVREYREKCNFWESWDVLLAVPWEEHEGITPMHERFYEKIATEIEKLGKTCFVPCRHRDRLAGTERIDLLQKIIVPTSDLVLYHANMNSQLSSGAIITYTHLHNLLHQRNIGQIWFIEEENYSEIHHPEDMGHAIVRFKNQDEGVKEIIESVKRFYQRHT